MYFQMIQFSYNYAIYNRLSSHDVFGTSPTWNETTLTRKKIHPVHVIKFMNIYSVRTKKKIVDLAKHKQSGKICINKVLKNIRYVFIYKLYNYTQ